MEGCSGLKFRRWAVSVGRNVYPDWWRLLVGFGILLRVEFTLLFALLNTQAQYSKSFKAVYSVHVKSTSRYCTEASFRFTRCRQVDITTPNNNIILKL